MMSKTCYRTSIIIVLIISLILNSCNTTDTIIQGKIKLTSEDYSCTEIWLRLQSEGAVSNPVTITANDKPVKEINIVTPDTVIYIDSLLPGQQYKLKALAGESSSNEAAAKTLDTTSHNITWEEFTFGDHTSLLTDIAVVNDKNIWAVGEIYKDGETEAYNAVHWDGEKWELKKILVRSFGDLKGYYQIRSVYAFSDNDVWFAGYADLIHWDGNSFQSKAFFMLSAPFTGQVNKMWGSDNNIVCAGNSGAVYNYNGQAWEKPESGTESRLLDVYGEGGNIFIAGYEDFKPSVLLRYNNGRVTKVAEEAVTEYQPDKISGGIKSVWVKRAQLFTLTWYDLFRSSVNTTGEGKSYWGGDVNLWGSNIVRGNDVNDIFTAGYNGMIWHFNGASWKNYTETSINKDRLLSASVKGNIIAAVGYRYLNGIENYGIIHVGKR